MTARPIQLDLTPQHALAAWPGVWPLAALWSGDPAASRSRWTVLARPSKALTIRAGDLDPGDGPVAVSQRLLPPIGLATTSHDPEAPPFSAGWIGSVSYDAGRAIEPRAAHGLPRAGGWPAACWARCDDALIFDHAQLRWWAVGDPELGPALRLSANRPLASSFTLSPLSSLTGRARYIESVTRVLEYIRAGDIYQANLAHALEGRFWGSSRGLFADLTARARPWYGAYLEFGDAGSQRAMLSLSPELFLALDPAARLVETRPMKGTRPASSDPRELELAHKDRAELNMIIDLQRNDLGRVCDFGSVRVADPRAIEQHGNSLYQATATVTGRLRAGLGPADLIAATFPGGSITGAPKIRAMQVIDELEPAPRGPYCGAIGWLGDDGRLSLNIAIRTAIISSQTGGPAPFRDASLSYSVGAGIVADSDPNSEWAETLDKASLWRGMTAVEDR